MTFVNTISHIIKHPINQGHKVKAIIRYIKWQIGSRLVPGAIIYDWINGSRFFVRTGEMGLTGNIYTGLHEFSDMAFLLHFLRSEDFFVDVGANSGAYTILACSAIGANGIAFEPIPSTYIRLKENVHLNYLDEKVKCINKGVGAQQGTLTFTSDRDQTNHVLAFSEPCINKVTIEATSLDTTLQNLSPALLKIDVEGYETPVIKGAHETLQNQTLNSVIMEINGNGRRYGFDESRILRSMADYGFETFSYNPFERRLINLESKNLNSGNILFIRGKAFVEKRLKNSPKVKILGSQF
jgi:FkbM family methyltransferase